MLDPLRERRNERYRMGICISCGKRPHSAGRPRCGECHQVLLEWRALGRD